MVPIFLLTLFIQGVFAIETKLELRFLSDLSSKMAAKTDWKPFCITVLTDLIVEPNFMEEISIPIMILSLNEEGSVIKTAQIACPNLIIATKTIDSLKNWLSQKKQTVTNRYSRRISVLLLEEESVPETVELLKSPTLQIFNDLIVINKLLGVYMRSPQNEDIVLLVDKYRLNFSSEIDFFPKRLLNLNGKILRATSFDFPPYNFRVNNEKGN